MAAGNYFLIRRQRQGKPPGDYHEEWYIRLKFPGKPEKLMNSGYDICPKCMAAADIAGLREREKCGCRVKSAKAARGMLEGWNDARMIGAFEQARMVRQVATLGDIFAAYMADGVRILKDEKSQRRNVHSLRRVVAFALGLWRVHEGGIAGVKLGALVADEGKIAKLPSSVLTGELREQYFRAAQGGALDWNEPQEGNVSINSTLKQGMDVFSKNALYHKLKGLQLPPLDGFLKGPKLPEEDSKPEPLTVGQWEAMMAAVPALDRAHPDMGLVNALLRQTGLRSSYVENACGSWLETHEGRTFMVIRNRPEEGTPDEKGRYPVPAFRKKRGTRDQQIPIGPGLAARLAGRTGYLVLPKGTAAARQELVGKGHNGWLKTYIGGAGERGQGNHRLRDTVASVLWSVDCPTAAQEALGHSSVDTTAKHYGKKIHVCPGMREELAAWLEVK
jgi:integrase